LIFAPRACPFSSRADEVGRHSPAYWTERRAYDAEKNPPGDGQCR